MPSQASNVIKFADWEQVMKLSTRVGRRFAFGIGVAATAILGTTAAVAATAASAAPASTAALVAPASTAIGRCVSPNTIVWSGSPTGAAAGHFYVEVEISNIGRHACTYMGYPGVSELNNNGQQVGLPASHNGPVPFVTVAAGGTAHFLLTITDPGIVCAHPVTGSRLRVFAPNQFNAETTPLTVAVCPHTVTLHVDAVHANAGIPNYSIN
jgi:hypothetical protein